MCWAISSFIQVDTGQSSFLLTPHFMLCGYQSNEAWGASHFGGQNAKAQSLESGLQAWGRELTWMPSDDVVNAYDKVGQEPEEDNWGKAVPKFAGAQPLEDEQEHQDGAGDPNDPGCNDSKPFQTILQAVTFCKEQARYCMAQACRPMGVLEL